MCGAVRVYEFETAYVRCVCLWLYSSLVSLQCIHTEGLSLSETEVKGEAAE